MSTKKQEICKQIEALHKADPTRTIATLCEEHGVSQSYYAHVIVAKKKKSKTPPNGVPTGPTTVHLPRKTPNLIAPEGYIAIAMVPIHMVSALFGGAHP